MKSHLHWTSVPIRWSEYTIRDGLTLAETTVLALATLFLVVWLAVARDPFGGVAAYLPFHIFAETFSIAISVAIFSVMWNAYRAERSAGLLLLGCAMLATGLLDFGHMLAVAGMPDFVTASSPDKGITFWLAARGAAAAGIGLAALWPEAPLPRPASRYVALAFFLGFAATVYWIALFHQAWMPRFFVPGTGLTPVKIVAEYLIIAALVMPAILFYRRAARSRSHADIALFAAIAISILSEMYFAIYVAAHDLFQVLGHVYKVIAYGFIYRAIFVTGVRDPLQKLQLAASQHATLLATTHDGFWISDSGARLLDVNEAYCRMSGYTREELLRMRIPQIEAVQKPEEVAAHIREVQRTGFDRFTSKHRRKDGSVFDVEISVSSWKETGHLLLFVHDVTERNAVLESLRKLNRLYATLSAIDSVIVKGDGRGELLDAICAVAVEHGQFFAAWMGRLEQDDTCVTPVAHRGLLPQHVAAIQESVSDIANSRGRTATAIRERRIVYTNDYDAEDFTTRWYADAVRLGIKASATLPIWEGGKVSLVLKLYATEREFFDPAQIALLEEIGRDIGSALDALTGEQRRVEAEYQLANSEKRFRALIENASDLVVIIDAGGAITYISPSVTRVGGYEKTELVGRNIMELVHAGDRTAAAADLAALIRQPDEPVASTLRCQSKRDEWLTLEALSRNLLHDPLINGIVINARDITDRKRAEDEVRSSMTQLRLITDNVPVMIAYSDSERRYRYANRMFAEFFGGEGFRADGKKIIDVVGEDNWRASEPGITAAFSGRTVRYEGRRHDHSGRQRDLEVTLVPHLDDAGRVAGLYTVLIDVTERKRAAQLCRENEQRLDLALSSSGLGVCEFDIATDTSVRTLRHDQIFGYEEPVLSWGQGRFLHHIVREDRASVIKCFEEAFRTGTFHTECRIIRVDQAVRWIVSDAKLFRNEKGEPVRMVGVVADVTERKHADERLRESEERFRAAFEQAGVGMALRDLNTRNGHWGRVNQKLCDMLGYSRAELLQIGIHDLTPPDERQVSIEYSEKLRRGEITSYSRERRFVRKDGQIIWANVSGATTKDSADRPTHVVSIIEDITESKRAADQLRLEKDRQQELLGRLQQTQSQLVQSEKMAAIGLLAAGVAHEINNPAGYIRSNLVIIDDYFTRLIRLLDAYEKIGPLLPRQVSENIASVTKEVCPLRLKSDLPAVITETRQGTERIIEIVSNLKEFSRVDRKESWQAVDINKALDTTLKVAWNAIKYKADVRKEYGVLPPVTCLFFQLNQVFLNLLVNASQAIEEHGIITIRTGATDTEVWVEISDTGVGIPKEHLNRIFDPFFTTKEVGTGTGLGLWISYGIVQKHRGRLEVASEVGVGTTFRVWLPIQAPPGV